MRKPQFISRIFVRCDPRLTAMVEIGAAKSMKTPSEYVRQAVFERLKADGVDMPVEAVAPKLVVVAR